MYWQRRFVTVGHQPFAAQAVEMAAHLELWSDNAAVQQTMCLMCASLYHKVGKVSSVTWLASGTSVSSSTSFKKTKRLLQEVAGGAVVAMVRSWQRQLKTS